MQKRLASLALLLGLICPAVASGAKPPAEQPPAENTTLKFQKTLYVHKSEKGKIFAETRKIAAGDTIWRILREEYGVSEDLMVSLVDKFREVNPGVNPNNLAAGQVVRVPFKIESDPGAVPPPPQPTPGDYIVRPGDTLWKILKNVYGVKKEDMNKVLAKVISANKGVKDINRLWVGQLLVIPQEVGGEAKKPAAPEPPPEKEKKAGVPDYFISVLGLLEAMGCKVDRTGESYIPLERGKSLRLPGEEFPIVSGPSGKKIILDSQERLSPAMRETLKSSWGYATVHAPKADPEELLAALIPQMGFFEATRGGRSIPLGNFAMLSANSAWSVAPTQKDLWDGKIHLIFPKGSAVDAGLAGISRERGFIIHRLGTDREEKEKGASSAGPMPVLDFSDPLEGSARFLGLLGIHASADKDVDCKLDGGVTYKIRTALAFEHNKLLYAVPPVSPSRSESILLRAGYFTFQINPKARPLARARDLLVLLGISHRAEEIDAPPGEGLTVRVEGMTVENAQLADALYPPSKEQMGRKPLVFLTEAQLEPRLIMAMRRSGHLPALVR